MIRRFNIKIQYFQNYYVKEEKMVDNNPNIPDGWLYIGDEKVRYALGKPGSCNLLIVGLNPSTATPDKPDPTIKRVKKIVEKENLNGWIMINLYPMRTPKPSELPAAMDEEISKKNIEVIKWIDKNYTIGRLYAAWGTNIEKQAYLVNECRHIVDSIQSEQWFTRGVTKYGHPRHPLYVPYKQKMEWFPVQDYLGSFE